MRSIFAICRAKIVEPRVVSAALLAVAEVVRTHFVLPRPGLLDPVVTCNEPVPADSHHLLSVMLESGSVVGKSINGDAAA